MIKLNSNKKLKIILIIEWKTRYKNFLSDIKKGAIFARLYYFFVFFMFFDSFQCFNRVTDYGQLELKIELVYFQNK